MPEAQGYGMNFKVRNLGSKTPHLYSAYVVSVVSQLHPTVSEIDPFASKDRTWSTALDSDSKFTKVSYWFFTTILVKVS